MNSQPNTEDIKINYTYQCDKCRQITIISKPLADIDKIEFCDKCNYTMQRLISGGSFILKGDGFHSNDYK